MPLKSPKEKFKQMLNKKKGIAEGLGPEKEEDIKLKVMKKRLIPKKKQKSKEQPNIKNIKNLA